MNDKYKAQKEYAKRKNLVKIGVDMPKSIRTRFKELCIKNGTTYSKVLKNAILDYLRSNGKENIIKIERIEKIESGIYYAEQIYLENGIILKPEYWTGECYIQGFNPNTRIYNHYRYIPIYDENLGNKIIGFEETI